MSDTTKESVIIENTPSESDLLIKKVNEKEEEKSVKSVEIFLGCILVSVAIMVTIFSFVLLQEFEVVPTNLIFVKSILQLLLFTISNKNNSISVKPADSRDATIIAVQGLLSGLAFICSIGAVRLLPLGDVFSIMFSKTVFLMLLMSGFAGRKMTKKKIAVTMASMLGLVVLIKNQTRYNIHQNGLIDVVDPLVDPYSSTWVGLGLALLYNMFSSMAEVLRLHTKAAAGVLSFWSAVGGLVVASLSTFVSTEPSILSGAIPSTMEMFLLISLSICLSLSISADEADGLVSKTFVTAIRSIEIPTGLMISLALTIDYIPNYVGYVGVVFIVISSVLAQATMEDEEKKENSTDVHEFV